MELSQRFINYCKLPTNSDPLSGKVPSSDKQFVLAHLLEKEMKEIGIKDVFLSEHCVVYGHIPGNCDENVPVLGFIAHMDTSSDASDENIKPHIVKNYDGKDILLNEEKNNHLSPKTFPCLLKNIGHDLIVTDGTTLLGGDDKAGIAEIMDMAEYLFEHPDLKHGPVSIAFTPDEEIGEGTDHFDLSRFGADFAYTVDGGEAEDVNYENFNAASAEVIVNGVSIHPGSAKNKMINACLVAMEFNSLLPIKDRPDNTEGYEGFNHITDMSGEVESARLSYIIRNHDKQKLEKQKDDFRKAASFLNDKYGENTIALDIKDTYQNMSELILPHRELIDKPLAILKEMGYTGTSVPIRGGTDGASLTYQGLLCPNLGTGGRNCHGRFEYVDINEMRDIAALLVKLVEVK